MSLKDADMKDMELRVLAEEKKNWTTPSWVLQAAAEDLTAISKDPRYDVNLEIWHSAEEGVCCVCLAGSVIANRLQRPIDCNLTTVESLKLTHPDYIVQAMYALDAFRMGDIDTFVACIIGTQVSEVTKITGLDGPMMEAQEWDYYGEKHGPEIDALVKDLLRYSKWFKENGY